MSFDWMKWSFMVTHMHYVIIFLALILVIAIPIFFFKTLFFVLTGLSYRPQIYTWAEEVPGHNEDFFIYRERWVKDSRGVSRQDWWKSVKPLNIFGFKHWFVSAGPWYLYNVGLSHAKTTTWPYEVIASKAHELTKAEYDGLTSQESLARISADRSPALPDILVGSPALLHELAQRGQLGILPGQNGKPNTYVIVLDENPNISAAMQKKLLALTKGESHSP